MKPKRTTDQESGIAFLRSQPRAMIADEQGKGKSRMLLESAKGQTLILCPAYTVPVWEDEHALWAPDLDATIVSYSLLCNRVANARGHLSKVEPSPRPELDHKWDTIICDESHYLKERKTNWTGAVMKVLSKKTDRLWLASGTPIPNWAHEIYTTVRMLDPDNKFTRSYWRWIGHWFDTWQPRWGGTKIKDLKEEHTWEDFQNENLGERYLRREWGDDEFPFSEQVIPCPMTAEQKRVYKELKKNYRSAVDGNEIVAWSDGALAAKLHKVCTGLESELGGMPWTPEYQSGKLIRLREVLEDRPGPVVIFCWYKNTARAIESVVRDLRRPYALRSGEISQKEQVKAYRDFQTGRVNTLIGTLATTSESLTLTQASTCVFVERSWRPSTNAQAIGRLRRIGQTKPVRVLHLVATGTVDERMLRVLAKKSDQQSRAITPREFMEML